MLADGQLHNFIVVNIEELKYRQLGLPELCEVGDVVARKEQFPQFGKSHRWEFLDLIVLELQHSQFW